VARLLLCINRGLARRTEGRWNHQGADLPDGGSPVQQIDCSGPPEQQQPQPEHRNCRQIPGSGVVFDEFGNPIAYYVLRQHPGDNTVPRSGGIEFDVMPVESVIHLFRAERLGQSRGIPEITPALPLFATLRRYTLAVLGAAEQAALPSGVIYTDAAADAESSQVEPMDTVEMDRGTWMTMPFGWKISQVKAEQPTTVYGDFKHEVINEIARCLNMPFNIAAGNSSGYNYASGRLDHQAFFKAIHIDQEFLGVLCDSGRVRIRRPENGAGRLDLILALLQPVHALAVFGNDSFHSGCHTRRASARRYRDIFLVDVKAVSSPALVNCRELLG
jgi:capsid protein